MRRHLRLDGTLLVVVGWLLVRWWHGRWLATPTERTMSLPGDELLPADAMSVTYAVDLDAPPDAVWPWLVQMVADRTGWYSYDALDMGGRPSLDRVSPRFQDLRVGDTVDGTPTSLDAFRVERFEAPTRLVFGSYTDLDTLENVLPDDPTPAAYWRTTWGFYLFESPSQGTRLLVRSRASVTPRTLRLPAKLVALPVHFVMQRRQLVGLRTRVEATRV